MIDDTSWRSIAKTVESLTEKCGRATKTLLPEFGGEIAVLFTNDDRLRDLNRQFRNKDASTNVLSFPSVQENSGLDRLLFLGDIALAFETCASEAQADGKTVEDHVSHLIVHGLLHLLGYDHQTEEEASEMESLEVRILEGLNIENPYRTARDL